MTKILWYVMGFTVGNMLGGVMGRTAGYEWGVKETTPAVVHYLDANKDERSDIVVRTTNGTRIVFLGSEDGLYKEAERAFAERQADAVEKSDLEKKIAGERELIRKTLDEQLPKMEGGK